MLEVSRDAAAVGEEQLVSCAAEKSKYCSICTVSNACHSLKHVATRLSPAGPHTDIQCRNRRRHNNRSNRQRRREDTANDPNS
jgi:hypothetical protein